MEIGALMKHMPMHLSKFVKSLYLRKNDQRGMALIFAISLMAIMSLLGVALFSVTTSDIQLSGNYRNQYEAFYAADRAIEFSIRTVIGTGAVNLYTGSDADGVPYRDRIANGSNSGLEDTSAANDDRNTIVYVGSGTPPKGIGTDANLFEAKNYIVTAVGVSPLGRSNPSRAVVRAMAAKIVPK